MCAMPLLPSLCACELTRPRAPADKNLGPEAQNSFSQTWGVSYALDNCSEWQDVLIEACKVALILVVLDVLRITKDRVWFEARDVERGPVCVWVFLKPLSYRTQEHVDFISIQAMLFNGAARNWWQQTRVLVRFQARMIDE
jgi:hypothetical protein